MCAAWLVMCTRVRVRVAVQVAVILMASPMVVSRAQAQGGSATESSAFATATAVQADTAKHAKQERRLYVWMSTYHFRARHEGVRYHPALAMAWRGIYAGAFRNSFDQWSVTAGYEDDLLALQTGGLRTEFGYRAGLLTGYKDWQHPLGKLPLIPFAQLRLNTMTRWVGVEFAYGGIVATGSAYVRF